MGQTAPEQFRSRLYDTGTEKHRPLSFLHHTRYQNSYPITQAPILDSPHLL